MTSSKHSFHRIAGGLLIALGLTGCSGDGMQDLRDFVTSEKSKQKGTVEPLPEIRTFETFKYNAEGLRNPFEAEQQQRTETSVAAVDNGLAPDPNRAREELESHALDTLRMVGTLNRDGSVWGIVTTNEGTIHRVRTGNHAGQNHGKIIAISDDKIELTEIIPDGLGGYRERQASLALSE